MSALSGSLARLRRIVGPIDRVLPELEITPDTYCIIVTRGHAHDQEALYYLVERGARYVGMIGSRRKIRLIFDNLASEGISAESLARPRSVGDRYRFPNGPGDCRQHLCGARFPPQPQRSGAGERKCLGAFAALRSFRQQARARVWDSLSCFCRGLVRP